MKRLLWFFIVFGMFVTATPAQGSATQGGATPAQEKQNKPAIETIKGTIDYMAQLGGYFIRGEDPGGELFIVNQNPKTLKPLKESGKSVTIQGYTTSQGAEYFFITKIDGKEYKAAKAPQ
jgi:hypothetical protein